MQHKLVNVYTGSMVGNALGLSFLRRNSSFIYIMLFVLYMGVKHVSSNTEPVKVSRDKPNPVYELFKFNFEEVSGVYAITLWILLGSLAKIGEINTRF